MAQGSHETQTLRTCCECDVPQLARNHYFTGKLLVERDFTDEQRYHAGKQQRHNQHLHGSGSVCGLKVKQHPNENCRDQYVVIEPGTAIDCCGRELLVTQKEYFDFQAKIAEKKVDLGDTAHTLQVCLRYSECPTEQVPVLFDDCGSDDTATQPNRIVEGYDFDVRIDPVLKRRVLDDVDLEWKHSQAVANASRVVVDEANQRFYVLTAGDASTLFVYNTDNYSAMTPQALNGPAMDVALSRDGSRAYVSVRQKNSVQVFDTRALGTPQALINELPAPSVPTGDVRLAVSPRDGFLYVLDVDRRTVTLWKPGINQRDEDIDDAEYTHIRVGNAPHSIVASPDGRWVLVANSGDKTISAIDAVTHMHHPVTLHLTNIVPSELAVADTDDGLKLYIADTTNNTVSILLLELRADPPFTLLGVPFSLAPDTLVDIAVSHTGRWLYVLLADETGKGRIQVIDAHKVEREEAYATGDSLPVGNAPSKLVLIPTRPHLYAAYQGKSPDADPGGVAIVHLLETTCEDLFKRALHECPDCDDDDECVVLATIKGYKHDAPITDAAIDNLTDRRLLPSTDLVTDIVRCILDNGGGKGRRGEEGPQGKEGKGIEAVQARIVDCDDEGSASIQEIDERRTLVLEIPRGCDGRDAEVPPPVEYTRICAINWEHRGKMDRENLEDGLVIAFNRKIRAGDLNAHSFQVLIRTEDEGLIIWCELPHRHLRGIELELADGPDGTCVITEREEVPHHDADTFVNGALFELREILREIPAGSHTLRVVLKGDLIQDEYRLGVDANHLPPWLPHRPTGDGVEGGTFESWFTVEAAEYREAREDRETREPRINRRWMRN
jgi:DNA-binding beta-propeller fold protein YncE